MGNFRELKVWQKSKDLAVRIYKLTNSGKISKDYDLRGQIRKSAVSIPSNIAEGDELGTDKQSIRHFNIAKGSSAELLTQLIIAYEVDYFTEDIYNELEKECLEISSMLHGLIKHRSQE